MARWIIAHRGDHSVEPENSLAAFEAAVNAGADMIEFDVRRLGDGTLVVHHDPETGGRPLGELTFAAMHETVPTLGQALEFCARRIALDIELKEQNCEDDVVRALFVARLPSSDHILTSFDSRILKNLRSAHAGLRTGLIVEGQPLEFAVSEAKRVEADYLVPEIGMLAADALARIAPLGVPLLPWVVNDPDDMSRLFQADSVAGLITDRPTLAVSCRRIKGC